MLRSLLSVSLLLGSFAISLCAQQAAPLVPREQGPVFNSISPAVPEEDFSVLAVDRTKLKPRLPGVSLGKEDTPAYSRELVRMEWRRGDFIDVIIVKPHAAPKPRVVLYLYSYPSETDRFLNDGWCTRATRDGLAAVGFVSALTGERFRNRPMREWFVNRLQESLGSSVHDVQLILDYLATRQDLSVDRVGMWGQGSGASIAILAAAADRRIAALDLLDPWGDWPGWLKSSPVVPDDQRAQYLAPEFLAQISKLDPVIYLPALKDRALRVQQISEDPDTPDESKARIAAAVPAGRLVVYKDFAAHHAAWQASTGISAWIAGQFSATSQSRSPVAAIGAK